MFYLYFGVKKWCLSYSPACKENHQSHVLLLISHLLSSSSLPLHIFHSSSPNHTIYCFFFYFSHYSVIFDIPNIYTAIYSDINIVFIYAIVILIWFCKRTIVYNYKITHKFKSLLFAKNNHCFLGFTYEKYIILHANRHDK